jgi:hypothetical protein
VKVFISSTYIDLKEHRKEVWNLLSKLSINVKGMETFGARKETPIETCLFEVQESDIIVFIIGMRYGSVHPIESKSYTELEYEEAIRNRKEIFVYLINESESLIHPSLIDFENYEKLKSFKNKLLRNHTIDFFENEKDLSRKLSINLKRHFKTSIKNFKRPKSIDCTVTPILISKEKWYIIIGYHFGQPIEFYIFNEESFFEIPNYVKNGKIIKRITERQTFYDFQYVNNFGYRTTAEGISFFSRISTGKLNEILNELIKSNTDIESIIKIIPNLEIQNIKNKKSLIKGLRKALLINNYG